MTGPIINQFAFTVVADPPLTDVTPSSRFIQ